MAEAGDDLSRRPIHLVCRQQKNKGWGGCYSTQNIRNVRLISWSSNEIVVCRETVKLKPWELSGLIDVDELSCLFTHPVIPLL